MQLTNKGFSAAALAVLLAFAFLGSADAQSSFFGYSPNTGSSNIFYPARLILNPTSLIFGKGTAYSAPSYLINNLTYDAAHAAAAGINKTKDGKKHYWNPANGPNAPVVDQVAPARWYQPPAAAPALPGDGLPTNPSLSRPIVPEDATSSEFMPVPVGLPDSTQPAPSPAKPGTKQPTSPAPTPAPDLHLTHREASPPQASPADPFATPIADQTNAPPAGSNLFARAFVEHVNSNFSGDISRALSDKQTREYARALGIIAKDAKNVDVPADRAELIKKILQDKNEDPLATVNTIRLLLKH